jgi:threonine dehydrogenase-like Zn-dependent dehydrogenase
MLNPPYGVSGKIIKYTQLPATGVVSRREEAPMRAAVMEGLARPLVVRELRVRPGDRVITSAAGACGTCFFCVRNEPQNCNQIATLVATPRFVDDGGAMLQGFAGLGTFAEVMTVHESSVIPIRTDLGRSVSRTSVPRSRTCNRAA